MIRRLAALAVLLALVAGAYLVARDYVRNHPQDVPWTRLDLDDPIGRFTARKLAALTAHPAQCRTMLAAAGADDEAAPDRGGEGQCGYADGVRLERETEYRPAPLVTSCPVAAAALILERQVIDLAAIRHFDTSVRAIHHSGSYSCRRINNRPEGAFSEHSTADALDITGFTLADGRRIDVARSWGQETAEGAFLREVRDGACRLFSTVLSPEYNQAHADHFHFDQAERVARGFRLCR